MFPKGPPHRRTKAAGTPLGPTRGQTDEPACGLSGFMRKPVKTQEKQFRKTSWGLTTGPTEGRTVGHTRGLPRGPTADAHRTNTRACIGPTRGSSCTDHRADKHVWTYAYACRLLTFSAVQIYPKCSDICSRSIWECPGSLKKVLRAPGPVGMQLTEII